MGAAEVTVALARMQRWPFPSPRKRERLRLERCLQCDHADQHWQQRAGRRSCLRAMPSYASINVKFGLVFADPCRPLLAGFCVD